MRTNNMTAKEFRRLFTRSHDGAWVFERYVWPGGYPLFLAMADGGCLCAACVESERGLIHQAALERGAYRTGWEPLGVEVNWEAPAFYCDHCNARIESAYAEDEAADATP